MVQKMNSKILSMLGISRKAGFAVLGFDKVKDSLMSKKAKIVCLCSDISDKTKKEIIFFADKHNIPIFVFNIVHIHLYRRIRHKIRTYNLRSCKPCRVYDCCRQIKHYFLHYHSWLLPCCKAHY